MSPICQHYRLTGLTLSDGKRLSFSTFVVTFSPISLEQAVVMTQDNNGLFDETRVERQEVALIRYTLTVWDGDSSLVQPLKHPVKDSLIYRGNVLCSKGAAKPIFELVPLVDIFRTRKMPSLNGAKGVQFIC